jgi:transposase
VIEDDLALIDALQVPIDRLDCEVHQHARCDPRVKVLTQLPGIGPFTALVLLAEIGDVTRFGSARKLAAWAGLTPTVRGSDRTVRHGHISKQGSVRARWALCEAAQTAKRHPDLPPATRPSPAAAARTSPPRLSPASCLPAPTTCSLTPRSPRLWPPRRPARLPTGRESLAPGELAKPHEPA